MEAETGRGKVIKVGAGWRGRQERRQLGDVKPRVHNLSDMTIKSPLQASRQKEDVVNEKECKIGLHSQAGLAEHRQGGTAEIWRSLIVDAFSSTKPIQCADLERRTRMHIAGCKLGVLHSKQSQRYVDAGFCVVSCLAVDNGLRIILCSSQAAMASSTYISRAA
jgi:hypothetical protein